MSIRQSKSHAVAGCLANHPDIVYVAIIGGKVTGIFGQEIGVFELWNLLYDSKNQDGYNCSSIRKICLCYLLTKDRQIRGICCYFS